jgi:hypothetical protein
LHPFQKCNPAFLIGMARFLTGTHLASKTHASHLARFLTGTHLASKTCQFRRVSTSAMMIIIALVKALRFI